MNKRESVYRNAEFRASDENDEMKIEGYFAVFDSEYRIADGMVETVAKGAFSNTLGGDIRALVDHNTNLVLGRTTAGTLTLEEDDHGLFGSIVINPNDSDAVNLYQRVKRGDVSGCSFGFEITKEDTECREDGSVHWTIREVNLFEVSCCTFPAYESTEISARKSDFEAIRKRQKGAWEETMLQKLKG